MNPVYLEYIIFLFFILFILREISAWKRILPLKYFFTPLVTLVIVLIPVLSIAGNGLKPYTVLVLISLLFALVADTILMIEEVQLLKPGMIFFFLGHVCYSVAFAEHYIFRIWNIVLILFLAVLSYFHINRLKLKAGNMLVPSVAYTVILDIMLFLAVAGTGGGISAVSVCTVAGAVLFVISDIILSINSFVKSIPHSTVYTWFFYAPAQFLIAVSTFRIS